MKFRNIIFIIVFFLAALSCGEKELFLDADIVLSKWAEAVKNLNYRQYRKCEAYPKERGVFLEEYRHYYPRGIFVTEIGELDKNDIKQDINGNSFIHRNIDFEFTAMDRKTKRPTERIKGNVLLIKYLEGSRKNDGWLMSNRTIIRLDI